MQPSTRRSTPHHHGSRVHPKTNGPKEPAEAEKIKACLVSKEYGMLTEVILSQKKNFEAKAFWSNLATQLIQIDLDEIESLPDLKNCYLTLLEEAPKLDHTK